MANKTILIKAKPELGFNFDYLLVIPDSAYTKSKVYLMAEVNNPRAELVSFDLNELIKHASSDSRNQDDIIFNFMYLNGFVADEVISETGFPYLMPLFHRYQGVYTSALSRAALLIPEGEFKRLDLQLIKMTEDAKTVLKDIGFAIEDKFILMGGSASGAFSNRFAVMHPELLKCAISGGQSYAIMPLKDYDGFKLTYPIGIADLKELTGIDFNSEAYFALPQFIYEGDQNDANDTTKFNECMSREQAQTLYSLFGNLPKSERLKNQIKLFKELGYNNIDMRVYEGFGHVIQTDDVIKFINESTDQNDLRK